MKNFLHGAVCAAILLLSVNAVHADDKAYEVKFDRPMSVGQKFDFSATADVSQTMKVEMGGKEVKNDSEKAKYAVEGTTEVKEITDTGVPSKFHLVIKKLQASEGDAALADAAAEGTEADGTLTEGHVEFAATKGELSDTAKKALGQLFEVRDPKAKVTADDIMGSKEQKKVGDTWNMNIKAMSEAMSGVTMDPAKTKGTVTIESAKDHKGGEWVQFKMTVDGTDLTVPNLGPAKEAKIAISETQLLPADVKNPGVKSDSSRLMHAVFEVEQQDQKMTVGMDHNEKRTMAAYLQK